MFHLKSKAMLGSFTLVTVLLLAACGKDGSPTPAATPTSVPAAQPTVAATQAPVLAPASTPANLSVDTAFTTPEVVKILRPSVVHIQTEAASMGFFNEPEPRTGVGTGIVIDTEGHILTNNHVVDGADRITVSLSDGTSLPAELIGGDPSTDLAVIRIEADGLHPARLGDSSELEVGDDVIAIGHALDLPGGPTVSKGVVSALGRTIQVDAQTTIGGLIQTDAAINPGNSGGPLVNTRAEVVGVDTAIIRDSEGIGFAININDAKFVMRQLIEKGFVERAFLGIAPVNVTPAVARNFDLPVTRGVGVARVVPGTGADRAGLQEEDIIVQLGEEPIRDTADLLRFLATHKAGETVKVVYYRDGEERTGEAVLGERPS